MADVKYIPNLRFPEFENDGKWKVVKLGDIAQFFKGKGISKAEVSNTGTTPCIRYGELYTYYKEVVRDIKSYTNIPTDNLVLSKANDVIIPSSGETKEDISTASCIIEDGIALGGDINIIRSSANGIFLSYYLNNAKKNDIAKIAQGISIIHLYNEQLQNLSIAFPSLPEQQKIASFLTSLDEQISAHTKKLEALKAHKKGLMQQLFPANGEKTPKLRFPEFKNEREWKEVKVSDIFIVTRGIVLAANRTHKTPDTQYKYPVYSSQTTNNGLMGYYDEYLYKNAITWTTDGANAGTVFFREGEFYCTNVCGVLLNDNGYANKCIAEIIGMKAKQYVSYVGNPKLMNNVMADISIDIPPLAEQQKIASFLTSIDDMIQAQDDKIRNLKIYKNGLMQQMFPSVEAPYYDVSTK